MTLLAALKGCYDRLAEDDTSGIAPFGYSEEKIAFALILSREGEFVDYRDLRQASGRKLVPQLMQVPQAVKRTVAVAPNFLWDKTSYALGIEREPDDRTRREHEAFKVLHRTGWPTPMTRACGRCSSSSSTALSSRPTRYPTTSWVLTWSSS
jgi:CRISPR-associated protein Csd1